MDSACALVSNAGHCLVVQLSAQDQAHVAAAAREAQLVPSHYVAKLAHYVAQLAQFENFVPRVHSVLARVEVRATRRP